MNLTCAIFDFDGTLFDSMFLWDTAGERYLRSLGKEPNPSVREDVRPLSLRQAAAYFQREYDLPHSIEEIMAGINGTVARGYVTEVLPKPGVTEFLAQLRQKGASLCIATATDRCHIEAALARCGMAHWFDAIFTCSEVGHGKDEPHIYQKAMEHFGADRSTTVVFEDAIHAAETARADGFSVIGVFDASEVHQAQLRRICNCYLADFTHTEDFWRFASVT